MDEVWYDRNCIYENVNIGRSLTFKFENFDKIDCGVCYKFSLRIWRKTYMRE